MASSSVSGISVFNCGYNGKSIINTGNGGARTNVDAGVINNVHLPDFDYMIIDFGLNDVIQSNWSTDTYTSMLETFVTYIESLGITPILATSDPCTKSDRADLVMNTLVPLQRTIASDNSWLLFDKHASLIEVDDWESLQSDGLHFGDSGHAIKASLLETWLSENISTE